jgi:hypothetical protein
MLDPDALCTENVSVSKVKIEEKGKKAVFLNPQRSQYLRIKLDGCVVQQSVACDWLVRCEHGGALVELKGTDVDHAIEQIEASFKLVRAADDCPPKLGGLVVCAGRPKHPSFDTKLQRAKQRFAKHFGAPIHVVVGNFEYEITRVLSFQGPF